MADISDDIAHLEQLAATLRRRLRVLETQHSRYNGRDVPPHLVLELEDTRHELARIEADLRRLRPGSVDARPPYLGLATFQEANADLFFGRDALVADLVERAGRAPFLAVLGASGSGKSSVVRAGLVPMLRGGALPGSDSWRYVIFKPGVRPLDALAAELAKLQGGDLGAALTLSRQLAETDRALLLAADLLLDRASGQRLVLVVDQFEELWTLLPAAPEQRTALIAQQQAPFIQLILTAVAAPDTPLLVVLTMRADFLHRAAEHPELGRAIAEHDVIVSPMTLVELRDAIARPAELTGGSFESGLVDELIAQTSGREGALPLLEYTLLELWKQRQPDGTMTWNAYQTLGGVEGALAARADAILQVHYTPEQQDALRQVLLRLVQPGEGGTDTRRRIRLNDVVPAGESLAALQALLKPLTDERLLTTGRDSATSDETIEVTHEALIRAWPTLVRWIEEARADLRLQLQLEEAAQEWQTSGQNADLLWSGLRLSNGEDWIARARPRFNARDLGFLDASRAEEHRRAENAAAAERDRQRLQEAQRNARRLRRFLTAVGVLLAVAIGAGVVAFRSQQDAILARDDAQKARDQSRRLAWAGESLFELQHAPERAMLLALAAQPADPAAHTEPMVARALFTVFHDGRIRQVLRGPTAPMWTVAWSPDGRYLLTGSEDGSAWVWDVATGHVVRSLGKHMDTVSSVAWSPDGKYILTGSHDQTVRVWDATSGTEVRVLRGHTGPVSAVTWSPDGKYILTGGADPARVWDAAIGAEVRVLHFAPVYAVAWSPDGKYILTGAGDQTARVWDAADGKELRVIRGHTRAVVAVAWSPDGKYIVTASRDNTARVWDIASGAEVRVLRGHTGPVSAVAWSPDGQHILTSGDDQTARVWDATSGAEMRVLRGHSGFVNAVAWSPDGKHILTGSYDQTARVWDASDAEVRVLHTAPVSAVAWSPDRKYILTGSLDERARIWDVASGAEVRVLRGHTGPVSAVAWSPDGQHILTGGNDQTARVWDATSGAEIRVLRGHSESVDAVAWSPDGQYILTGSWDQTARVWDVASGAEVRVLREDTSPVLSVAWSPDGKYILTGIGSPSHTARVWDATNGAEERILHGHAGAVFAVAWNPDGKYLLTGAGDGTVPVWDATSGAEVRVLRGHTGPVYAVAWSPDGKYMLTGSLDGTARAWDAISGAEVQVLNLRGGPFLTAAWSPDGKYILAGSLDGTARIWLADPRLMIADFTRRVCDIYGRDDAKISAEAPDWNWPGCAAALAAVSADLKELDALHSAR